MLGTAAAQAIAATQQSMQQQGRRTTSLKASVEATKKTENWPPLSESLSSSSQAAADTSHGSTSRSHRVKKYVAGKLSHDILLHCKQVLIVIRVTLEEKSISGGNFSVFTQKKTKITKFNV